MNRIIILIILFTTTLSVFCKSQRLDVDEFKKEYKSLGIKFLNSQYFNKSRNLVFKSIKTNKISSDTVVLVEEFTDETSYYMCSFYESGRILNNYEAFHPYDKDGIIIKKIYIRKTNFSGMTPVIIKAIKNNDLDEVLEKGKELRFTPNAIVLITIAIKEKSSDYAIKTFMINEFKE